LVGLTEATVVGNALVQGDRPAFSSEGRLHVLENVSLMSFPQKTLALDEAADRTL
jgi:hypothetical protein